MKIAAFWSDEQGATAVTFCVVMASLFACGGLALDGARYSATRHRVQTALDAAVLAGAKNLNSDPISAAMTYFKSNAQGIDAVSLTPTFYLEGKIVRASVSGVLETTFSKVIGVDRLPLSASAAARGIPSANPCVLVMDRTSPQTFLINSGADVNAPTCEIDVKSTASPAAIFNSGTSIVSSKICIEGRTIIDNGGTHPNLEKDCRTVEDPFAGKLPVPSTTGCIAGAKNYNGGTVSLTPGVYCDGINFNAAPTINFAPGVYVILGGDWNVNGGTWTGNGVTFYFADRSKIQFNSAVNATMTPPTSGPYKDIAMFEAPGLARSPFVLDDSRGFQFDGLLYLPSRDVIFNGGSRATVKKTSIVVNTLILNQTVWSLETSPHSLGPSVAGNHSVLVN